MRGLMMGRFQPFHLGHLDLARQILAECEGAIIAVTSSQFNYLPKDPFTAGERIEMIHGSLSDSGIDVSRCIVTAIENQFNVATWYSYLKASLPEFGRVYSGNNYVAMLLADSGHQVIQPKFLDRKTYRSTHIRSLIAGDGRWEELVPSAAARVIRNVNGVQRIKVLVRTDTDPTGY